MAHFSFPFIWITLFSGYLCQIPNTTAPTTTLPSERGLVMTILDRDDDKHGIVRHIPIYPGYESFSGLIPGITIVSSGRTHVLSFDIEYRSRLFFMYDFHLATILVGTGYNKDLEVSRLGLANLHVGVSRGTTQIAFDWLSHTVYWTDKVFRWIIAVPGELAKLGQDYYKIIVDTHLDAPDGLTLDPLKGYLFWTDNGKHPKIERSDLKGDKRHTIVKKHLVSPLSIEADIYGKRIYWIDSYTEAVLTADYDGNDFRLVTRITNAVLFDITIYRDVLYISDIRNDDVYTLNKTTGRMSSTIINLERETVYGLAVYGEYNQPLKDKDYCAMKNCSHLCISEENGATCVCSEGYKKKPSSDECEESTLSFHKAIVIANATHICLMDIRSFALIAYDVVCKFTVIPQPAVVTTSPASAVTPTPAPTTSSTTPSTTTSTPAPTASPDAMIKLFDLDIENRVAIFVTMGNYFYKRPLDLPIESNATEEILEARGSVSGMAYDVGYSENLYWTESDTNSLWMVDVATKSPRRLIVSKATPLVKPRDIVILSTVRRLAWVEGESGDVSIQSMAMNGRDLRTVVSGLPEITSVVYEDETRMFYFLSNGSIHQVALDGTSQRTSAVEETAYLLLQYKNYLSWIYVHPAVDNVLKTKNIDTDTTGAHGILGNVAPFVGIKALDDQLKQPAKASPCAYLNGGCDQICIPEYTNDVVTKTCECGLGFVLDKTDKISCRSDVAMDDFILVTDLTNPAIHQIDMRTNKINAIKNQDGAIYMGVYFDPNAKKIIWTEYKKSMIYSSNLDGTDQRIIGDLGNAYPYRLDKDLTTGNIYYTTTSQQNAHIGLLTPSGKIIKLKKDVTKEILGDIVVHPGKGWVFYTVIHALSYVARVNMDGTNEVKVVYGKNVTFPDGLAIDFIHDHLYWSDAVNDTIQRCNLDGQDCVTLVNRTGMFKPAEIRDLATDGRYLYFSADRKDHIDRVDLVEPYNITVVGENPGFGRLDTIALYSSSSLNTQPVSQACQARNGLGNCSSICLPTATGRTCACADDIPLKPDGRTCSTIYQCSDVIRQDVPIATGRERISIVIDDRCMRQLGDQCQYRCPDFFAPVDKTKLSLTCTNVGWDMESENLCKEISCPEESLLNGKIDGNCSRRTGEVCHVKCNPGYTKITDMIFCNRKNKLWTPQRICVETTVTKEKSTGLSVPGAASGIGILVLVVIILAVVIVYLVRRKSGPRSGAADYGKAEFHKGQDGTIAIENPGYVPAERSAAEGGEHPYATVDTSQVQPEVGGNENLPEVAQIEVTRDTATLTYDSWLKSVKNKGK